MSHDKEMLLKIHLLATEIIKQILRDKASYNEKQLLNAVENLSRSIIDLTSTQLDHKEDIETTLKATLSKVKISYHSVLAK